MEEFIKHNTLFIEIAASFGILLTIFNSILKFRKKCVNFNKKIDDVINISETVFKELTPNGGKSIKDVVDQIYDLALESNLRSKHILNIYDRPMYECSANGKCISANVELCKLFGLPESEMLGYGWLQGIKISERAACNDAYQKAIATDAPYTWDYTVVNQITHKHIRCRTQITTLRKLNGEPAMYQGWVIPISDVDSM